MQPLTYDLQLATLRGAVARSGEAVLLPPATLDLHHRRQEHRDPGERPQFWCHDTPGALQPDQCLSLLTHDELQDVLPRKVEFKS